MNIPLFVVIGIGVAAMIACLTSNRRAVLAVGLSMLWLCLCYMLLIPFVGAVRIALAPVDANSPAYIVAGNALNAALQELTPARFAIAGFSLTIAAIAYVKSNKKPS